MIIFLIFVSMMILAAIIWLVYKKEIFTKMLFLNYISGLVVLLICMMSLYSYSSSYVDVAIIYTILSFVAFIAFLNYFIKKDVNKEKEDE